MRRVPLLVLGLLVPVVLTGCRIGETVAGVGEHPAASTESTGQTGAPDEYADYLAAREAAREGAALLVRGLADALDGTVGVIDGDWDGCGQRGEETVAFTYSVLAAVDDVRPDPGLETVGQVLDAQGWTSYDGRRLPGDPEADAAHEGVSVTVEHGAGDDLVVLASTGCFRVSAEHHAAIRGDLGDDRIVVPD